jgi:hypothetical protein
MDAMLAAGVRLRLQSLTAVALIACTHGSPNLSRTSDRAQASPLKQSECYSLSYNDSTGGGESRLFPTWIEILPGSDSGAVRGRHHATVSESVWRALLVYSGWKKIAGDSLEILFTGRSEGIRIHVVRFNRGLTGRATWLTDITGMRTPSLPLVGARESCPVVGPG